MKYKEYHLTYKVWLIVYYSWNMRNREVTKFSVFSEKKQCKTWLWTIELTKIRFSHDCVGGFRNCLYIYYQRKKTILTIPISLGYTHILSLLRFFISITNSRNRKNRFSWKCVGKASFFLQNQNFHKICNRTIPKYPCLVYQKAGNWRCSKNGIFVISRNYDKLRVSKYTDQ